MYLRSSAGIFLFIILLLTLGLINFHITTEPPAPAFTDRFLVGVIQTYDVINQGIYDEAGLNAAHKYITTEKGIFPENPNRHTPKGWVTTPTNDDHLTSPVPTDKIREVLNNMYSHNHSRNI